MGMFSEINAEANARGLEAIILDAMHGEDWFSNRTVVLALVKKHLLKWYYSECGEAWINANPEIVEYFKDK